MKTLDNGICPVCNNRLRIKKLACPECLAEFPCDRELSPYDYLNDEQKEFLKTFLSCRGNLKELQEEMNISYPFAKKKLESVLLALGLKKEEENLSDNSDKEDINMFNFIFDRKSKKASEIVKTMIADKGGKIKVSSVNGKVYEIRATSDPKCFECEQLPGAFDYKVFDIIVELLKRKGGKAEKGNGRNYKIGEKHCDADTVVGTVGIEYYGKKKGESVFDPVFVLAAVMDSAGIIYNRRGYIELTETYRKTVL